MKRRKQPIKLVDFVTDSKKSKIVTNDVPNESPYEHWRRGSYIPIMDCIISNFNICVNLPFAVAVDAFINLKFDEAGEFIDHYIDIWQIDKTILLAEGTVMKNLLKTKGVVCNLENLKIYVKEDITPNLFRLLQVAIGLPISSAGCERSFSAMRRIKTWLRTSMLQDRFSALALLNIENNLVKKTVSAEKVLERFAEVDRKIKLV